jgi:hypothetical protein
LGINAIKKIVEMDKTVARKRGGGCGSVLLIWGKGDFEFCMSSTSFGE